MERKKKSSTRKWQKNLIKKWVIANMNDIGWNSQVKKAKTAGKLTERILQSLLCRKHVWINLDQIYVISRHFEYPDSENSHSFKRASVYHYMKYFYLHWLSHTNIIQKWQNSKGKHWLNEFMCNSELNRVLCELSGDHQKKYDKYAE